MWRHEGCTVLLWKRLEAVERRAFDLLGCPLGNVDGDVDGGLVLVQFGVEAGDPRIGVAAILIEGDDALQIGIKCERLK